MLSAVDLMQLILPGSRNLCSYDWHFSKDKVTLDVAGEVLAHEWEVALSKRRQPMRILLGLCSLLALAQQTFSAPGRGDPAPEIVAGNVVWLNANKPVKLGDNKDSSTLMVFSSVY